MNKALLISASALGFLGIALGAMGAHLLKDALGEVGVNSYLTAIRYLFYHVFAILITQVFAKNAIHSWFNRAGWCFLIGIVLFSGSILLLSTIPVHGVEGVRMLGPITPIGGLVFMVGWLMLVFGFLKVDNP
jgi:uncharacterized membrane protein YgdD (TMEM256/DUF423 family)